ncbi:hypothetical protein Celaphus_00012882 [Cervus elaphus hippelaphus]|uniref:UBA domain-containing protein n=1 Tax=Cervus elaphus hippelaphus TaxID=46360 RepID=A0A212CIB7_CEREH|nr:hypothetical protein Celaphus_00012882 [Cervus elaphus hippelaphus]
MAAGETQLYAKVFNKLKCRSTPSLLDPLLGMGFPAHTALKALAATGRKTAEEASNWLHCHCNDPSLDDPIPQEYALFLCPTGPLLDKLQDFWRESRRQCAKNRAHEVFPHITLCDFFTCEDQKVECLYEALKRAGDRTLGAFPSAVPLVLHSSISYLGFFVDDSPADVIREFAVMFATEASILADCSVKPCTKQLHLTLAHKFYPHHQRTLEQLARAINPGHRCQWTAALYSRDMRFVHYQVGKPRLDWVPHPGNRPAFPLASLLPAEGYDDYVHRCAVSMEQIVSTCPQDGVILVVGHGSALDTCTRPLLGLPPRDCADFAQLVRKIPSLGMCFCEENKEEGKWELVNPPVKTLTHGSNSAFNWRNWIQGN